MSRIDPDGCIIAVTPAWTKLSIPSTNGKKASDAAKIGSSSYIFEIFHFIYSNFTTINLLSCPDPIPIVALFFTRTIADLTNLHTLSKIKFLNTLMLGFS